MAEGLRQEEISGILLPDVAEMLTDEEVGKVMEALNTKKVDELVKSVMEIEKVLTSIKVIIAKVCVTV